VIKVRKQPRFRVGPGIGAIGDQLRGLIVEDRGKLGSRPRRYVVHTYHEPDLIFPVHANADELEPAAWPEEPLDHDEVIAYLKRSGLYAILMNNSPGGRDQPSRLTHNSLGAITHVSLERGDWVATLPYWALGPRGRKFVPKRQEVIEFLSHFGLNREAEDVVATAWAGT
jgi:hypothetical protein